jgi:6-phosphogluconolactonase (cycloisomerase 2 family)
VAGGQPSKGEIRRGRTMATLLQKEQDCQMKSKLCSLTAIASVVMILYAGLVDQPFAVQYLGSLLDDHYDGLSSLVLSPGQQHAYAVTLHGGVFWFNRNAATGQLSIQGEAAWLGAGTNMIGGMTTAISPDAKHLYVGAQNGLYWFACNTSTGVLTYAGQVLPSDTSVHIYGNFSLVVSPDGHQVYVASWYGNAVHWFVRDAVSGALTYGGRMRDSIDVPGRMVNPSCIAVIPDGAKVLVTSYSSRSLSVFTRNATSGSLVLDSTFKDTSTAVNGLLAARSVAVSPDGKDVYVGTAVGTVSRFRFGTNGALVYNGVLSSSLAPASALTVSPDGQFLYAGDWNSHNISWFRRDSATGALISSNSLLGGDRTPTGGALPASLVIPANGSSAYAVGRDRSCVTVLNRSVSNGTLTVSSLVRNTLTNITDLGGAYSVVASKSGADVYVAAATDDAIDRFARNSKDGSLTFDTAYTDIRQATFGAGGPYWLGLSPDQKFLYAACYGGLYWYVRDLSSGRLTLRGSESRSGLSPVRGMFSPDGRFLYLAYESGHAVMWFGRDSASGTLTFVANVNNQMDSITVMYSPNQAAVSPDGKYVYVSSGFAGEGVFWFNRNAATGSLTYGGKILNNAHGITIMTDPSAVTISPNGKYVYVGCGSSIVWLSRDSTGALKLTGSLSNTMTGLLPATALSMSPDGLTLYEMMGVEVAWYNIDTVSGRASLAGSIGGTLVGGQALWGIQDGALSPNGDYLYTAGSAYGAVAWLSTGNNSGAVRFGETQHAAGQMPKRFRLDSQGRIIAPKGYQVALFDVTGRQIRIEKKVPSAGIYLARLKQAGIRVITAIHVVK